MKYKILTLCSILALGGLVLADGPKTALTGAWKWVAPANPDGQIPKITFDLKSQGETLNGTIARTGGKISVITNGVVKGDKVIFQTISEGNAGKSTTTYNGKLNGDSIKGAIEIDVAGKKLNTPDWEIKRITQ
jgi:hypothetical protein